MASVKVGITIPSVIHERAEALLRRLPYRNRSDLYGQALWELCERLESETSDTKQKKPDVGASGLG